MLQLLKSHVLGMKGQGVANTFVGGGAFPLRCLQTKKKKEHMAGDALRWVPIKSYIHTL